MATSQYKALFNKLNTVREENSQYGTHSVYCNAYNAITGSDLSEDEKNLAKTALIESANSPNGIDYKCDGIDAVFKLFEGLTAANDDSFNPEPPKTLTVAQLTEKLSNGRIFGVSFIKRTTGELRTMTARLGVKKFLKGGKLSYSPAENQLLTVFDMSAKGYRSVALDAIQRVSVGGQTFSVEAA